MYSRKLHCYIHYLHYLVEAIYHHNYSFVDYHNHPHRAVMYSRVVVAIYHKKIFMSCGYKNEARDGERYSPHGVISKQTSFKYAPFIAFIYLNFW